MSLADQILAEIQHEADQRTDDVLLRLLERYDSENEVDVPGCRLHNALRFEYTKAAIAYSRCKSMELPPRVKETLRLQLQQARKSYRTAVHRCGCSDKYDAKGQKRKKKHDGEYAERVGRYPKHFGDNSAVFNFDRHSHHHI